MLLFPVLALSTVGVGGVLMALVARSRALRSICSTSSSHLGSRVPLGRSACSARVRQCFDFSRDCSQSSSNLFISSLIGILGSISLRASSHTSINPAHSRAWSIR